MVQGEKAQLQLELDAVAAELVSREQALAAAKVCLRADDRTIKALESQADYLKDWLSFFTQQLAIARDEAKVCMLLCWVH